MPRVTVLQLGIVLQIVLLVVIAWYFLRAPHATSSPASPRASTVPPEAPPKKAPPPVLTPEERRLAMDGLQALQGLRSVTEAGLNYGEYSRRILDGKVQVDRYVNAKPGNMELKRKMAEAMEFYLFAGDAWNAKIRKEYESIGSDPRVDLCPLLRELRDRARGEEYISVEKSRGIAVAVGVSLIWGCASAKIRDVEETLSPDKT